MCMVGRAGGGGYSDLDDSDAVYSVHRVTWDDPGLIGKEE